MSSASLLGRKIESVRKVNKLSQAKLAEMVGVSRASISLYENGNGHPSYKVLGRLADALGVSLLDLAIFSRDSNLVSNRNSYAIAGDDTTISQRITMLMNRILEGDKSAFSERAGISSQRLEEIVGERQNAPTFAELDRISLAFPEVRMHWLMFGRGEMLVVRHPPLPPLAPYQGRSSDFISADAMQMHRQYNHEREVHYRQDVAKYERVVSVVLAMVEYLARKDNSPELRAILDMLPAALSPPLTLNEQDNLHEQEMEEWRAQGNH